MSHTPQVYGVDQAAELLSVSRRTLFTWTQAGQIPHYRRGRRVFYPADALDNWIRQQTVGQSASEALVDG